MMVFARCAECMGRRIGDSVKELLFHEIYGSYFRAVEDILKHAVDGTLTGKKLRAIVKEKAFAESELLIPDALESGEWALLDADYSTPITKAPDMPLTLLQKRWMKALLLDPRIRLFAPDTAGLEDVKPLFTPDMFVYFDRYGNGDPYENEEYIGHFHMILEAIEKEKWLQIDFHDRKGNERRAVCLPGHLEYSSKDDKFRLVGKEPVMTINLARIDGCRIVEGDAVAAESAGLAHPMAVNRSELANPAETKCSLTFELIDERGALERVMLHFSHLEKETKRLDEKRYQVTIHYDRGDETEILIRILSFGPNVRVTAPEEFIEKIRERLLKQLEWQNKKVADEK